MGRGLRMDKGVGGLVLRFGSSHLCFLAEGELAVADLRVARELSRWRGGRGRVRMPGQYRQE